MAKKQLKFNVTFRDNKKEEELYNWIRDRGQIGGIANFIKSELNKLKEAEEKEK